MVILFFDDGHAERFKEEVLQTPYAQTEEVQQVNILTPEEIALYKSEGVELNVAYEDPRKALDWAAVMAGYLKGAK